MNEDEIEEEGYLISISKYETRRTKGSLKKLTNKSY